MQLPETIFQSEPYRGPSGRPAWVFFPHLGAMLGWGTGIWHTLGHNSPGNRLNGVRQAVLFNRGGRPAQLEICALYDWQCEQDTHHRRLPSMFLTLAPDASVDAFVGRDLWRVLEEASGPMPPERDLFLDGDEDHRLVVAGSATRHVALQRRTRRVSERVRVIREELGLSVEPMRGEKRNGSRVLSPAEKEFAARISGIKREYVAWREPMLMEQPVSRPVRWRFVFERLLRERQGEVERGRNGQDGLPKVPYAPEELIRKTCHDVARLEAQDLTVEYAWNDLCRLTSDGLIEIIE